MERAVAAVQKMDQAEYQAKVSGSHGWGALHGGSLIAHAPASPCPFLSGLPWWFEGREKEGERGRGTSVRESGLTPKRSWAPAMSRALNLSLPPGTWCICEGCLPEKTNQDTCPGEVLGSQGLARRPALSRVVLSTPRSPLTVLCDKSKKPDLHELFQRGGRGSARSLPCPTICLSTELSLRALARGRGG